MTLGSWPYRPWECGRIRLGLIVAIDLEGLSQSSRPSDLPSLCEWGCEPAEVTRRPQQGHTDGAPGHP
ncbi:hypothetical protein AAFF_G00169850 [Aldrovandia affinis]|uniref:Uncharacterized protein n=1 Tax=Aldrovandia affinis TaxID=143900 RepID=A0AAD7RLZ0_9TELE|nr:hypothetical protein AAFF_G00169850 [Aldrovandia affinis]